MARQQAILIDVNWGACRKQRTAETINLICIIPSYLVKHSISFASIIDLLESSDTTIDRYKVMQSSEKCRQSLETEPQFTTAAQKLLVEHLQEFESTIHEIAKRRVLDEKRKEISEIDVLVALETISPYTKTSGNPSRKWSVRILVSLTFTLLVAQVAAFYQLLRYVSPQELPLITQTWLVFPAIFVLVLVVIFTWFFREDWL